MPIAWKQQLHRKGSHSYCNLRDETIWQQNNKQQIQMCCLWAKMVSICSKTHLKEERQYFYRGRLLQMVADFGSGYLKKQQRWSMKEPKIVWIWELWNRNWLAEEIKMEQGRLWQSASCETETGLLKGTKMVKGKLVAICELWNRNWPAEETKMVRGSLLQSVSWNWNWPAENTRILKED